MELYVKLDNFEIDGFLHANDLSYLNNSEEELYEDSIDIWNKNINLQIAILRPLMMKTMIL